MGLSCFPLLILGFLAPTARGAPLSLEEAVSRALHNNPQIREAKEAHRQSLSQVSAARASFFPKIQFQSSSETRKDAANHPFALFGASPYNFYSSSIRAEQPLLVFGARSGVSLAQLEKDLRQVRAERGARDLTIQVIESYLNLVVQIRALDNLEKRKKINQDSLATALRRERFGLGKRIDVLQIQTELELIDGETLTARDAIQASTARLANLIGDETSDSLEIENVLRAPDIRDLERQIRPDSAFVPEFEEIRIQMDQANARRWIAMGPHLPSVSATGAYMWNSFTRNDLFSGQTNAWAVGVQLNVPLFSGFSSLHEQKSIQSDLMQLEIRREQLRSQLMLDQVVKKTSLRSGFSQIVSGERALKAALGAYEEAKKLYRQGQIDFTKLHGAEEAYLVSLSRLDTAHMNFLLAAARYLAASGQNLSVLLKFFSSNKGAEA